MSWKKEENYLFEENEEIVFRGSILNMILFPLRLKISFSVVSEGEEKKTLATP